MIHKSTLRDLHAKMRQLTVEKRKIDKELESIYVTISTMSALEPEIDDADSGVATRRTE